MTTEKKEIQYKKSKETKGIIDAIDKFIEKNNRDVCVVASICNYKKDGDVKELRFLAYGTKRTINISLSELRKYVVKDKEDFINW